MIYSNNTVAQSAEKVGNSFMITETVERKMSKNDLEKEMIQLVSNQCRIRSNIEALRVEFDNMETKKAEIQDMIDQLDDNFDLPEGVSQDG